MINPRNLVPGVQLTNAVVTYYTAPDHTKTILLRVTLTNTTATARAVTLYLVPRGGTAGAGNMLLDAVNVPAATGAPPVDITAAAGHILEQGDSIQALASAGAAITLRASGFEQT